MNLERRPVAVIDNPLLEEIHPALDNAIHSGMEAINKEIVPVDLTQPYPDNIPNPLIPIIPNRRILVPGMISGRHALSQLNFLTQVGFVLNGQHEKDIRSPRTLHGSTILFDLEGRGNKPTIQKDGNTRPEAELLFTSYAVQALAKLGLYKSAFVVDPHDKDGLDEMRIQVMALTVLPELLRYFEANVWKNKKYKIVIADDGAIGRSLFASFLLEIPIVARYVKSRRNGQPEITAIYGGENIKGNDVLMIDDCAASFGTIITDSDKSAELGALGTTALVTHMKDVKAARDKLSENLVGSKRKANGLNGVIVSNTTPYTSIIEDIPEIHIVDVMPTVSKFMQSLTEPTAERLSFLRDHIFPMHSKEGMIALLHKELPHLAPDYRRSFENQATPNEYTLIHSLEEMGIW